MASSVPPVKGVAFTFYPSLISQANTNIMKTSVTLAAGDVTLFGDGVAKGNIGTLPTEIGTTGVLTVALSAAEMNYDCVVVRFCDAAGAEWQDLNVEIFTAAQTLDATDVVADGIKTKTDYLPSATAGAAGGVFIAGTNAATTITSAAGAALTLSSTGGNGAGLVVSGNGSGAGIDIDGGATGAGVDIDAAAAAGIDITASPANWVGAVEINALTGRGINIEAPNSGMGVVLAGQLDITGVATAIQLCSTDGPVVNMDANGAGTGVRISTGTGGTGIELITSSTGVSISTVDGDGVNIAAAGAGHNDIVADMTGNITGNLSGSVGSVTGLTASNLDTTVSSRAPSATALSNATWTNAKAAFLDGSIVGVPALVWSYATRTLTSLSALVASIAASVWTYATRTLTSTAASTTAAVSGSTLTITNACTYSATLTGLTIPADWLDMWFTVKDDDSKADSASIIQIHKSNPSDAANDGLVCLNGAAGTKADGALTVDQAAGTVTILIAASSTDDLVRQGSLGYDLKVQSTAAGVTLLTAGTCDVELTETKTID